jgi:hypothetical protein
MSHRPFGASLLLATFVLVLPSTEAYGQKKRNMNIPGASGPALDSGTMAAGEYVGYIKTIPGTDRVFSIEIDSPQLVAAKGTKGAQGNVAQILKQQKQLLVAEEKLLSATTPQQRQQASIQVLKVQRHLTQSMAGMTGRNAQVPPGYTVKMGKREIEFQASPKAKVRTMVLPEQLDDKGNPRKPTAKELDALKGKDKALVGYESSLDRVEVGQVVKLTLSPAPAALAGAPKDKDKDDEKADKKMQVSLIVITKESGGLMPQGKGKKK